MRFNLLLAALLLQGCVYVPHTTSSYDEQCKIQTKRMTLRPEQLGTVGSCAGSDCVVALAALGAASAVISGSIVVVGNVVYWLEKQGKCASA